jgi:hypothetical protein
MQGRGCFAVVSLRDTADNTADLVKAKNPEGMQKMKAYNCITSL